MTIEVEGPDGSILEFPDGTSREIMRAAMQKRFSPVPKGETPAPFLGGVARGVTDSVLGVANLAEVGLNAAGIGNGGVVPALREKADAAYDRAYGPSNVGGEVVGNIIGTLPAAAVKGGAAVQGGLQGAILSHETSPLGIAKDAAIGAVGGVVGDRAVRGIARAVSPKVAPAVKKLRDEGVDLTMGQIVGAKGGVLGKSIKGVEDRLSGLPFVGDAINSSRRKGVESFNRAVVNRALKPIGETLPDDVPIGHDAIRYAGDRLSKAYRDLLPSLNAKLDRTFATRVNVLRQASDLADPQAKRLEAIIQDDLGRAFDPKTGRANGRALKRLDEKLGDYAAGWGKADDPDVRALGTAVGDLRDQVKALIRRNNPKAAGRLRQIDNGWANIVRAETAAKNSADGVFSPNQFNAAVRQSDRSIRKRGVARGTALMQDLAKAGSEVLPSQVPDSGTAGRIATALAATGGAGMVSPPAALGGAAAIVPYLPGARRVVQNALTGRQGPGYQAASRLISRGRKPVSISIPPLLARRSED